MINTTGTVIGVEHLPAFVSGGATDRAPQSASTPMGESTRPTEITASDDRSSNKNENEKVESLVGPAGECVWPADVDDFQLFKFIDERLAAGSTNIYAEALEQMERRLFAKVLDVTSGNQSKTAEVLGITRGKVRDRIAAFGILVEKTVSVGKH